MSLNKKKMVREIGRRTRQKNHDVQMFIDTLIDVWTDELVAGGRIELEGFCTLNVKTRARIDPRDEEIQYATRVLLRTGKRLKARLKHSDFV